MHNNAGILGNNSWSILDADTSDLKQVIGGEPS